MKNKEMNKQEFKQALEDKFIKETGDNLAAITEEDGSYSDSYVNWLENQIINTQPEAISEEEIQKQVDLVAGEGKASHRAMYKAGAKWALSQQKDKNKGD